MRRVLILCLVLGSLAGATLAAQAEKAETAAPQAASVVENLPVSSFSYDPGGRRDPFKNLMAGRDVKEKPGAGGLTQLSIGDMTLIGIVKSKSKLTAIVSGPQGFPHFVKAGDRFADGYVLNIQETQAVFRVTSEKGIPLMRPKDIVKEINPEER
jgi:Tfp pilus assembly protein PilP